MVHEMKLQSVYFDKIKNGEKIYEIRLNDEKRKLIKVGDNILFKKEPSLNEQLMTKVIDLIYYSSFEQMINDLPPSKVGFSKQTISEIVDIYHQFYTVDDEERYGVIVIKLQVKL